MRILVIAAALLGVLADDSVGAPDFALGEKPPRVVQIVPENGATNVDPELDTITITFSEPMTDRSWSVTGGGDNYPDIKSIFYKEDCTVLVIKVDLKPGWTYRFGLNSPSHKNFVSRKGVPLEPMLVTFKTKEKGGKKRKSQKTTLPSLGKAEFTLSDVNGFELKSQDFRGVPLFIVFGAAW
jgi:hypothetical protein